MKALFLNLGNLGDMDHPRHAHPPMDIGYCAAMLEKLGYEIEFIDTNLRPYEKRVENIDLKADVVVIKPAIGKEDMAIKTAKRFKDNKSLIIAIGPLCSTTPERIIFEKSPFDLAIVGESEAVIGYIVSAFASNGKEATYSCKGICFYDKNKKQLSNNEALRIGNLEKLGIPKHDLFVNKGYGFCYPMNTRKKLIPGFVMSSRGCPYNCAFCSPFKRVSLGQEYRMRPVDSIIEEVRYLKELGANMIYFIDDLFGLDRENTAILCKELAKEKISWAMQTRTNIINHGFVEELNKGGCECINLGIESLSDDVLKKLDKKLTASDHENALAICKQHDINIVCNFMLGCPGEKKEDIEKVLKFCSKHEVDMIEVLFLTQFPGARTELSKRKAEEGFQDYDIEKIEEIEKNQKYLYRKFYLSPSYISRFIRRQGIGFLKNIGMKKHLVTGMLKKAF